jgi:hypothetical protein
MNKYERIVSALKEQNPYFEMIRQGLKPEEIKQHVIESLVPYFDHKEILEQFAIEALIPESINLLKLQKDKSSFKMFQECFCTYRLTKGKDSQHCFESLAQWQPQILQSLSKFWSILYLELDKNTLEIEEFLHESLRNIGDIIEGLIKPYLKILLHQIRISNGILAARETIDSLDLGTVVDELIKTGQLTDHLMPPPWSIRLNQWRNIAYHHDAKIENNEIICWYGTKPNIKQIRLQRHELLHAVHTIYGVYGPIRLAHTLFFTDNLMEITKFHMLIEERQEAQFLTFFSGIASQGFEIIEYRNSLDETKVVVKDVSDMDPNQRRFHAS